jgi:hypothetical protein
MSEAGQAVDASAFLGFLSVTAVTGARLFMNTVI